jgi:hypothetical protein
LRHKLKAPTRSAPEVHEAEPILGDKRSQRTDADAEAGAFSDIARDYIAAASKLCVDAPSSGSLNKSLDASRRFNKPQRAEGGCVLAAVFGSEISPGRSQNPIRSEQAAVVHTPRERHSSALLDEASQ